MTERVFSGMTTAYVENGIVECEVLTGPGLSTVVLTFKGRSLFLHPSYPWTFAPMAKDDPDNLVVFCIEHDWDEKKIDSILGAWRPRLKELVSEERAAL